MNREWKAKQHHFQLGHKTYIMGILNCTPDSFSDGGKYNETDKALFRAEQMILDGADIIDIGGESTRPGSVLVSEEEELSRILPVLNKMKENFDIPVSIDTYKASVAEQCLLAKADLINDVWGMLHDRRMAEVISSSDCGYIAMSNHFPLISYFSDKLPLAPAKLKGTEGMNKNAESMCQDADGMYQDICRETETPVVLSVAANFLEIYEGMAEYHIAAERVIFDPGIGFGITTTESLAIIRELPSLLCFRIPLLVAPSRKRFIGEILDLPVENRLMGTAAAVCASIHNGADFIRVHDVKEISEAVKITDAIVRG